LAGGHVFGHIGQPAGRGPGRPPQLLERCLGVDPLAAHEHAFGLLDQRVEADQAERMAGAGLAPDSFEAALAAGRALESDEAPLQAGLRRPGSRPYQESNLGSDGNQRPGLVRRRRLR
jgi:hypothetical protein